mgnify:CR=1 FL=1|jgi:hypothetical protein|nr:MAG TPA: hypothetical protein [Bacteriophage sp.]
MAFDTLLYYPDQDRPLMPEGVRDMDFYTTNELYQRVEKKLRWMIDNGYSFYKPTKAGIVFGSWEIEGDKLTPIEEIIKNNDEMMVIEEYMETDGGIEIPTKHILDSFLDYMGTTLMDKYARYIMTERQKSTAYFGWRKLCRLEERNEFKKVDWKWKKIDGCIMENMKYVLGIHKVLAPFKRTVIKVYKFDPHAFNQEEPMVFFQRDPFHEMSDEEAAKYYKPFRGFDESSPTVVKDYGGLFDKVQEDIKNTERPSWNSK